MHSETSSGNIERINLTDRVESDNLRVTLADVIDSWIIEYESSKFSIYLIFSRRTIPYLEEGFIFIFSCLSVTWR